MRIVVTGGSGFIGTILSEDLIGSGHGLGIYDKAQSQSFPERCVLADVRNRDQLTAALSGCQAVFHLAAEHKDDVHPISLYHDVNVGSAVNLTYAAERNAIRTIILVSTVALYGLNVGTPDEDFPARPFNPYGASKHASELVFRKWAQERPDRTLVIVRPVVIFGEGNRGNVYNLLNQIACRKFVLVGNGRNKKSMGYVRNLSQFLVRMLELDSGIHVFNYADKPDLTVNELIAIACRFLETPPPTLRIPYPIGLLGGYFFDKLSKFTQRTYPISSIRIKKFCANTQVNTDRVKETGFSAPYTLEEGLKRMIRSEFT
jgi:GlcNAc-P-P-Und epimerase